MTKQRYIPTGYIQFKPEIGDYPKDLFACYIKANDLVALFYIGKRSNPSWHIRFSDEKIMKDRIKNDISKLMSWEDMKQKRKEKRKNVLAEVKVGDLYYNSWGYDQTNIDFYQITGRKGKLIQITPIAKKYCGEAPSGGMSDNVLPIKDKFIGEPVWKRSISMKFGMLFKTDEKTKHFCSWYA